jgi:hypothetical protein
MAVFPSKPLARVGVADGSGEEGEPKSKHQEIKHGILREFSKSHARRDFAWAGKPFISALPEAWS